MRNRFNSIFSAITSIALLTSIFLFSSCDKDDDNKPPLLEITDPNIVAKSVVIENSTYISTGNPPAQTINETAPLLDDSNNGKPLFSVQGSKIIVTANIESGSAAGFYVKVVGADGYYKVTSTSATGRQKSFTKKPRTPFGVNARVQEEGEPTFSLEVPENIKPGEFCISYCVYDAQNQVSNIIQQCVTVKSLGGENSSFLSANEWAEVKVIYYDSGQVTEFVIGENFLYKHFTDINCGDTYVEIESQEEFRANYVYLTFAVNGALSINSELYEKRLDYEKSDCEAVYIDTTYTENTSGAWSYNSDTKNLILIYNEENEDGDGFETIADQGEALIVNNNLILKLSDGGTGYYEVIFKPKD